MTAAIAQPSYAERVFDQQLALRRQQLTFESLGKQGRDLFLRDTLSQAEVQAFQSQVVEELATHRIPAEAISNESLLDPHADLELTLESLRHCLVTSRDLEQQLYDNYKE